MIEILTNFFSKYFRQPKSIILAIIIILGICTYTFFTIDNIYLSSTIIFFIILLLLFYIIDTIKYNSIPIANESSETSVLIRIFAETEKEYNDVKFKLAEDFKKFLSNQDKNEVVYIPYHLTEKYKFNDNENIIKLLRKTNCIFLATIRTKSEEMKDDTQYITEINLGLIHPGYEERIEKIFKKEFCMLGSSTNRIEYTKKNKMTILETTAKRLSYICQYILGRAYFLNGDLQKSAEICDRLYRILCIEFSREPMESTLKKNNDFIML